jgi:mRNA interferase MazF
MTRLNQYEFVIVNLDPTIGKEIRQTRPCIVISPNEMNWHLETVLIAPLTTVKRSYPSHIEVKYNRKKGYVVLDQIRTVNRQRVSPIGKKAGTAEITAIKSVLYDMLIA